MAKRSFELEKLTALNWYPRKIYGFNSVGDWQLIEDEKLNLKNNSFIKNYSGGVSIRKIHSDVKPLSVDNYKVLDDDVGGDAPKDFIRVYEFGKSKKADVKNWEKHIAKVGHKWYPLESISEHLLNRIGEILGLEMAHSQLRIIHGQLRFLSKYFLQDEEILVHGAQIYSTYLEENDDKFVQEIEDQNWARALLTFQFTHEAVKFLFPQQFQTIMNHLVELLVFDAITGNNDRHFYNWAVITHIEGVNPPKFSPIYDSARGLFWNSSETVIERRFYVKKGKKFNINIVNLDSYINSSRPKIGWEGWHELKEINHFELIAKINEHYPLYQNTCLNLIKEVHLQSIMNLLDTEFKTFFTPKRLILIKKCLQRRFEKLNLLCKSNCYD